MPRARPSLFFHNIKCLIPKIFRSYTPGIQCVHTTNATNTIQNEYFTLHSNTPALTHSPAGSCRLYRAKESLVLFSYSMITQKNVTAILPAVNAR